MNNFMLPPSSIADKQMYTYMYQLIEQLNTAMSGLDEVKKVSNEIKNNVLSANGLSGNGTTNSDNSENEYNQLKSLVIKTADKISKEVTITQEKLAGTIVNVNIVYGISDTYSTEPTEWLDTAPEWEDGKYMWQKVITTYSDGSSSETDAVCITGATGNGISSVIEQYATTNDKTVEPLDEEWQEDSVPPWTEGTYIWTRSKITYTDGNVEYTTPICDSSWESSNQVSLDTTDALEKLRKYIESDYVAQSEYGTYQETISDELKAVNDGLQQHFKYWSELKNTVESNDATFDDYKINTEAYIRTGIIEYDSNNIPIFGVAIGQDLSTTEVIIDGVIQSEIEKTGFLATYTSKGTKFWQDNVLVAYMTGNKLYILQAEILDNLIINDFKLTTSNGLAIIYTGE